MTSTGTSKPLLSFLLALSLFFSAGCWLALHWVRQQEALSARIQETIEDHSIPLRRELVRLDGRVQNLTRFFLDAEDLEQEARFLAGLDDGSHQPFVLPQTTWDEDLPAGDEEAYRDRRLLISTTLGISQLAGRVQHTAQSYEDIAAGMMADAPQWAAVPSITPVRDARQSSNFGRRRDPFTGKRRYHTGVDLVGPYGTSIYASAAGKVRWAGWAGGYGKLVEIDHGNGIRTRYAHNSRILVRAGEYVRRGQVIARLGSTGRANAPHLHYEVLVDGRATNPGYVAGIPIRAE